MVDLALMAKLVDALPPGARLILLGDKDQLAAVEAGAVFAELCEGRGLDATAAAELERITGQPVPTETPTSRLGDSVVLLTHSHRFAGDSGIGELARRINAGDARGTLALLREGRADLAWNAGPLQVALLERLDAGYAPSSVRRAGATRRPPSRPSLSSAPSPPSARGPGAWPGSTRRWRRASSAAWASPAASAGTRGGR